MLAACEPRTLEIHIPPPSCTLVVRELTCPPVFTLNWHRDNPIPWYNDVLAQEGTPPRLLTVEILFRTYGCKDPDPTVAVLPLQATLLVEIVRCRADHKLS
jgi:hypothetical protein